MITGYDFSTHKEIITHDALQFSKKDSMELGSRAI